MIIIGPRNKQGRFAIHICTSPRYEFQGWCFEYHRFSGPWPLRKDGELCKFAGRKFWKMIKEFDALQDKEQYRVGGGCEFL